MTSMRRLLTARHILTSVGSGIAVFILFTSVIGIAVAQDDSPQEAPQTFSTARPAFGDQVSYQLSGVMLTVPPEEHEHADCMEQDSITGGSSTCEVPSHAPEPVESLQPFGPLDFGFQRDGTISTLRDAAGIVHDVEYIDWTVVEASRSMALAHVIESGVPVGYYGEWSESESHTYSSQFEPVIQSDSYSVDYQAAYFQPVDPVPPCLLRHGFQGAEQVLGTTSDAFGECKLIGTDLLWSGGPMTVVGVETEDGVAMLHLRGVTDELELDVWLDPKVPYPARMLTRIGEEFIQLELSEYTAGTEDALAYIDAPRDPLAPLKDQGLQAKGLSFEGIDHPFPPEEAYQAAYDDAFDNTFKQWADANPEHTILHAIYFADGYYGDVESEAAPPETWRLLLGTEHGTADLDIERRTVDPTGTDPQYMYEYEFYSWSDSSETLQMPSIHPTAADLAARWEEYLPEGFTVHPTGYWYESENDAWTLIAAVFENEQQIPLVYGMGEQRQHAEHGEVTFDADSVLLRMAYERFTSESGTQTIAQNPPSPTPNPDSDGDPPGPTALQAKPEAPWVPPTPTQTAGAAGAAVLTGILVYLWPALKSAPYFGLFSRLRRPELLGHPSRKKILDVIEADPGVHFKELQRRTGLSNGNLVHHLRTLTTAGLVSESRTDGYTCFFAAQDANRKTMRAAPALRSEAARNVLEHIQQRPGIQAKELADELGLGPSTIHYHLKRLQEVGLAHSQRDGRHTRFFPLQVMAV